MVRLSRLVSRVLPAIVIAVFLFGCGGSPEPKTTSQGFDRKTLLASIGQNVILPSNAAFKTACEQFQPLVQAFTVNPTEATLLAAQQQWLNVVLAWQRAALFNIGAVEAAFIHPRIETKANPAFIEAFIAGKDTLNESYIESHNSSAKGVRTIEYLLFSTEGGNAAVLEKFTTAANAPRRKAYLDAATQNLLYKATILHTLWNGEYKDQFIAADGTAAGGSLSMLLNRMVARLEEMTHTTLAEPLGKKTGGEPRPELLEGRASQSTLGSLRASLQVLEDTYYGGPVNAKDRTGLDHYLDAIAAGGDTPLSARIAAQFQECQRALGQIPEPLANSLVQNTAAVEKAYKEMQRLLVLFKADLSSSLGIAIVMNDGDGD